MRIISKTNDFYDCGQAYGQDPTIVYVRDEEDIEEKNFFNIHFRGLNDDKRMGRFYISQHTIGFCGKIYPVLSIRENRQDDKTLCYTIEDVDKFVTKITKEKDLEGYRKNKYKNGSWGSQNRACFARFFEKCQERQNSFENIFIENKCPIIIDYSTQRTWRESKRAWSSESSCTLNGSLKALKFQRIFDPYIAYQELSMYVGSVLGLTAAKGKPSYKGEPMSMEVSDVDLAAAKGYNEWRFRKEPTKKKRGKKK